MRAANFLDFLETRLNFEDRQDFPAGMGIDNPAQTVLWERDLAEQKDRHRAPRLAETVHTYLWSHHKGARQWKIVLKENLRQPGQDTRKWLTTCS